MRVLCEWMRGETNYIARPFGPVQKLLPACLPACLSSESATYVYVGTQPAQPASQPAHKRDRKWAIIKRKK